MLEKSKDFMNLKKILKLIHEQIISRKQIQSWHAEQTIIECKQGKPLENSLEIKDGQTLLTWLIILP